MSAKTKKESPWRSIIGKWDMTSWHPIVVGCLIVWILSCNQGCAEYIASNKNTLAVLLMIFYGIILCVAFYQKKDTKTILGLILLGGFLLRSFYVLASSHGVSLHDLGSFFGFDSEETGGGHIGYIEYLYKSHHLPDFDPRTRWSFYQPPGFYIISAVVLGITRWFRVDAPLCYESIQIVTLFFSSLTVWIGYRMIREFSISDKWVMLLTAFLAVHPFYSIMAVSLTNDCMAMFFMALAIWYTIHWHQSPEIKKILVIAFAVGMAMFTKLNAALISFGIGFVFIYVFWVNRKQWKQYLIQFAAFLAVCAPIGLFAPIRNLILYQMPLSYVQKVDTGDTTQFISESTLWARLGLPTWKQLSKPFMEFVPNQHSNVWIQAVKTSFFDEITPDVGSSMFEAVALMLLWSGILLVVVMNLALIRSFGRDYGQKIEMRIFLLIEYLSMLVSYVVFCFKEPFLCTMNFRYIPISFWFPMIGAAIWLQKNQSNTNDHSQRGVKRKEQKKEMKTHKVFRALLIGGLCVFIILAMFVDLDFVAWSETRL